MVLDGARITKLCVSSYANPGGDGDLYLLPLPHFSPPQEAPSEVGGTGSGAVFLGSTGSGDVTKGTRRMAVLMAPDPAPRSDSGSEGDKRSDSGGGRSGAVVLMTF
uniref:Uncharacterized protein n=1 Tax=Oryza nivara TaxID=4536 RepID=A0A0E0HSI5_ORYNI